VFLGLRGVLVAANCGLSRAGIYHGLVMWEAILNCLGKHGRHQLRLSFPAGETDEFSEDNVFSETISMSELINLIVP
jgi:hypothetical protein